MKWVSVEDELPKIPEGKHAVSVLVNLFDNVLEELKPGCPGHAVTTMSFDGDFKEIGYAGDGQWGWFVSAGLVTHWMYLPDPPNSLNIIEDDDIEQRLAMIEQAFVDLLDGQSRWYEIAENTGWKESYCREMEKLYKEIVFRKRGG